MSQRDAAAALGVSRQELARWIMMSTLPEEQFEAYLADCDREKKIPSSREIELLARRAAGKSTERERRCPHCGCLLWAEGLGDVDIDGVAEDISELREGMRS